MIRLNIDGLTVESYETGESDPQIAMAAAAACTPTLDSLVEHLCPGGVITLGCHEPYLAE